MNNTPAIAPAALPSFVANLTVPSSVAAAYANNLQAAISNVKPAPPRLKFSNSQRFVMGGPDGDTVLPNAVLDFFLVAVNPSWHYTFFEKSYEETRGEETGNYMSRYPLPSDEYQFMQTNEWKQRVMKQRAVIMLADDPSHTMYVVDFGYDSLRRSGKPAMNLFSFAGLLTKLQALYASQPAVLSCFYMAQMSYDPTAQTARVHFSLHNQSTPADLTLRYANEAQYAAMVAALSDGSLDSLLDIEYDSRTRSAAVVTAQPQPVQPQPVQQAPVQQAPVQQAPVQQAPVQQAPVQQAPVQQAPNGGLSSL